MNTESSDSLWREAFVQVEQLLALEPDERARALHALSDSHPTVIPLVQTLLRAADDATLNSFLEGAAVLSGDPSEELMALKPGDRLGNYAVEATLGRGGMGEVWRARRTDGAYDAAIALKVLHAHLALGSLRERFVREGRILGALSHANIARLLDAGVSVRGELYLVLELVDGQPIDTWCDEHALALTERIRLFMQVCDAVAYAHAHMVVHRDLKPPNILVTPDGLVKLLDFGIAKLVAEDVLQNDAGGATRLGERALTPDYAAPEQLRGEGISAATDVYALGVLLYQLLSGSKPYTTRDRSLAQLELDLTRRGFVAPSDQAVRQDTLLHGRAANGRDLRKLLRGDLDAIVAKALRPAPADRYADARALREDLSRHLEHEPVQARTGARAYVWRLFLRRNWKPMLAAAVLLSVLLIGTAAVAWQARLARIEAAKALAVKQFLLDIFEQNSVQNADVEKARSTTAQQLLDIGGDKIMTGLRDQPEVRDELLATVSDLYDQLELYDPAIRLARARLESLEKRGSAPSSELADAQVNLGRFLYVNSDFAEAEPLLRQSLNTMDQIKELSSARRAHAMLELGRLDSNTKPIDDPETVELLRKSVAMYEQCCANDGDHPAAIQSLARLNERRGDFATAERGYRKAIELLSSAPFAGQSTMNNGPADIGRAYLDLGSFLLARQRYREAEQNLSAAYEVMARTLGAESLDAVETQVRQGQVRVALNQWSQGETLILESLRTLERIDGPDKMGSAVAARTIVSAVELQRGELATASATLTRNQQSFLKTKQTDAATCSSRCVDEANVQARLWMAQGKYGQARGALGLADGVLLRLHREKSEVYAKTQTMLAELDALEGNREKALTSLHSIIEEFQPTTDLREPYVLATLAMASLSRDSDPIATASLAKDLLDKILALPDHEYFADWEARAQTLLGEAQAANCHSNDAEKHLRRALELRTMIDVPESPWLAETRAELAVALLNEGKRQEAGELLSQASQAQKLTPELAEPYRERVSTAQTRYQNPSATISPRCGG